MMKFFLEKLKVLCWCGLIYEIGHSFLYLNVSRPFSILFFIKTPCVYYPINIMIKLKNNIYLEEKLPKVSSNTKPCGLPEPGLGICQPPDKAML